MKEVEKKQEETGQNLPKRDEKGRLISGGPSLNPNGRPQGSLSLVALLKKHLEEIPEGEQKSRAEQFIAKNYRDAMKGDPATKKLLWNYVEGLPQAKLDVTSGGEKLTSNFHDENARKLAEEYEEKLKNETVDR